MNQRDEKYLMMTTAPVEKLVCSFAVPSIISMMISSIYNIADTFFVGRLDTQSTAAVGVVFSYMGLLQAVSFYFGHGSGNFISRALGAKNSKEAEVMASTGFFTGLAVSLVMVALCLMFITPVLNFCGATPTVLPYAVKYFRYILLGTPFMVGTFILNNQMRLQGNASVAMYGIMSGAILNIILDPVFIFALDMGVAGAGLATALAQMAGFFIMLHLSGRKGGISIKLRNFKPSFWSLREINAGGLPSLARQGLMAVAVVLLNNFAGNYGDEALAAFAIVGRVMHLACAIIIGFGQGFQPVCGFNYGAGLYGRVRKALLFCISFGTLYAVLVSICGELFAPGIISVFRADDAQVISLGAVVLRAQCITFPLVAMIMLTNMYLQTTRQTASAVLLAIARSGMFLVPALIAGRYFWGLDGIIAAQPIADVLSFALAVPCCVVAVRRMMRRLIDNNKTSSI